MSRYIDADALIMALRLEYPMMPMFKENQKEWEIKTDGYRKAEEVIDDAPSIDIVRCENCRKSHIDGKTTHYLWCTEWGRSTDTFGYCERGEREGE